MAAPRAVGDRYEVTDLKRIIDPTGTLYVAEFAPDREAFKRVYFITGVPRGQARGGHAHKSQAEYLIAVQGSLEVHVERHLMRDVVALDRPGRALFLPPGYWRDLVRFSDDAVLSVLSSEPFDESDYIRDRAAFRRWELEQA